MILPKEESRLFFKLYIPLVGYANQYDDANKKRPLDEARKILYGNRQIFTDFLTRNPEKFDKEKLGIIARWQEFIMGDFILIKSLKKYGVLLSMGEKSARAYGVVGLTDSVSDMSPYGIGTYFTKVVLLPWKDRIIWDGLFYLKSVIIGRNYMRSFTEEYERIKQADRIIEHFD